MRRGFARAPFRVGLVMFIKILPLIPALVNRYFAAQPPAFSKTAAGACRRRRTRFPRPKALSLWRTGPRPSKKSHSWQPAPFSAAFLTVWRSFFRSSAFSMPVARNKPAIVELNGIAYTRLYCYTPVRLFFLGNAGFSIARMV